MSCPPNKTILPAFLSLPGSPDVPRVREGAQELHEGGGDGAVLGVPEGIDQAQEGKAEHKLQLALVVGPWGDTR